MCHALLQLLVDDTRLQIWNAAAVMIIIIVIAFMWRGTGDICANASGVIVMQTSSVVQDDHVRIVDWSTVEIVIIIIIIHHGILWEELIAHELLICVHSIIRGIFLQFLIHNSLHIHLTRRRRLANRTHIPSCLTELTRVIRVRNIIIYDRRTSTVRSG